MTHQKASVDVASAQAALRVGDVLAAERILAAAFAEPSPSVDVLLLMSAIRRRQSKLEEAEALARRAVAADDLKSGRAAGRLGAFLQWFGRSDQARVYFEEALRREPDLDAVRVDLVRCLLAMGAHAEAQSAAEVLVARRPSALAFRLLSDALCAQDKCDEALIAAERALALSPGDRGAVLARARALEGVGQTSEALGAYAVLARSGFANAFEVVGFAQAMYAVGQCVEAEQLLARALPNWPSDTLILSTLCKVRWINGAGAAFIEPILNALARQPADIPLRLVGADLLYRNEQAAAAEMVLREGLTLAPDDARLLSSLGVVLGSPDRIGEALEALDLARRLAPDDDQVCANRAAALIVAGRADEALAELAPLRRKSPDAQNLIAREALALRVKGDPCYRQLFDYEKYVRCYELPTPPGYTSLAQFNRQLAEHVRGLYGRAAHPLDQSLRNGTQTSQNLARSSDPIVRAYIAALDTSVRDYIARLPDLDTDPVGRRKTSDYSIRSCWSVRLRPGGFHVNHVHPHGWISSSYYVEVPSALGEEDHAGWIKFGESNLPVPNCGPELFIQPEAGKLVLFPSYMWHGTVPFSAGERITMPFDIVPMPNH